jgi:hypothetical protein
VARFAYAAVEILSGVVEGGVLVCVASYGEDRPAGGCCGGDEKAGAAR